MQDKNPSQSQPDEKNEGEGHLLLNVGKTIFLVAVLVAAWFILDRLISGK